MTKKLALLLLILIYGCNADINDRDKRNENWVYWLDSKTGKSSWIPVSDQTTVKDGKYISFYSFQFFYGKTHSLNHSRTINPRLHLTMENQ